MKEMFAVLVILLGSALLASEVKVKKTQLPAPVQKAADELGKSSQVIGYSKETENGKVLYEVETRANGVTKDVTFDEQGNTVTVEQEVALTSLPAAVQEGLRKGAGKARITKVETITKGPSITYEAALKGGAKKEIVVDGSGRLISQE